MDFLPMDILVWKLALVVASMGVLSSGQYKGIREYCQWESFNATCNPDEVIVMRTAEYGRMELGRCLLQSYGFIGCRKDVLPYVDSKCSGRHTCSFNIPNAVLDKIQPCPGDLKSYLRAGYACLKVATGNGHMCRGSDYIRLTEPVGYIASAVTEDMQLGSSMCPWMIQAKPGQRIIITLLDFSLWVPNRKEKTARHPPETSGICHIYANIRERTTAGSVTVCGGDERERTIYTSETESVQIEVANMKLSKNPAYFIFKYEAIGCPDPKSTPNMLVERNDEVATVTCKSTGDKWDLTCKEGRWLGKPSNCSEVKAWGLTDFIEGAISLPQGVLIAIIIGIALFIAIVILGVGLWSLKKRQVERSPGKGMLPGSGANNYGRRSLAEAGKEHYPMLANQDRLPGEREGDYTSTWHRRAAMPATVMVPDGYLRSDYDSGYRTNSSQYNYHDGAHNGPTGFNPPHVEHIYESPKFARKDPYDEDYGEGPFYHELDPERLSTDSTNLSSHPDLLQCDTNSNFPSEGSSFQRDPWPGHMPDATCNGAILNVPLDQGSSHHSR